MKKTISLLTLALCLFLVGCSFSSFSGHTLPGEIAYDFRALNKTFEDGFQADSGQTIHIEYDAEVESGELTFVLVGPDQTNLWEMKVDAGSENSLEDVVVPESGRYVMKVTGQDAEDGHFQITWTVE